MLKDKTMTYISLFSSAGVGCYGFCMEGFECVATNELISRRMEVQRVNKKCKLNSGYISGDITNSAIKQKIYEEIDKWSKMGNDGIDVVIATPPCQGISVINHKKNNREINRNSLVVESVKIIKRIQPHFFIFENVMAFQKTLCITPDELTMPIGEYIRSALGTEYIISGRILNFMNYGSNSSRTRTLMIGVSKKFRNNITPFDLYPSFRSEKTLREVIYDYPRLEWGEIDKSDFYHAFRTYNPVMRSWIHGLKESESAFDNVDPIKRPHRVVDGKRIENTRKNRDKYTRQPWDRFVQCVHTRNDQLAAQNTVHPEQDRVFTIRELMDMMTVPRSFRWVDYSIDELNAMSEAEKRKVYKEHEMNIRQCLGEAVPTEIMRQIAANIKFAMQTRRCDTTEINHIIADYNLIKRECLIDFLQNDPIELDIASLMRIAELCNSHREKNAAYYTNKFIVNEIMGKLPVFNKDMIRILEPSVGAGSFVPFLFKQYENIPHVILDVVDIDVASLETFNLLIRKIGIPANFTINQICHDFITWEPSYRYDLAVGNPPFSKLKKKNHAITTALKGNVNQKTNNLAAIFLEKCIRCSDCVSLVLNKNILSSEEYTQTRDYLRTVKIDSIIDFGRYGFTGVSIETICMIIYPRKKPRDTTVYSMKYNMQHTRSQDYLTDSVYPSFVIYRDEQFDEVAKKLHFDVFTVFRDRQITKTNTIGKSNENCLWVIKARNIDDDGLGVTHIPDYDVYLPMHIAKTVSAFQFINNEHVYLTPNMTYNPRVIDNLPNTIPDGSVAVLIPKENIRLTKKQKAFFSSEEYRRFYGIARNLSTQSINVDNNSVYYYGVLRDE